MSEMLSQPSRTLVQALWSWILLARRLSRPCDAWLLAADWRRSGRALSFLLARLLVAGQIERDNEFFVTRRLGRLNSPDSADGEAMQQERSGDSPEGAPLRSFACLRLLFRHII